MSYYLMVKALRHGREIHFATVVGNTEAEARADAEFNHGGFLKGREWRLVPRWATP